MEKPTDPMGLQDSLADRTDTQIRLALSGLATDARMRSNRDGEPRETYEERVLEEAANRLQRLERLTKLLGLLAPAGTAPRTALEKLYEQSGANADETPMVLELRQMLVPHWGDWNPVLLEAEGLPALDAEQA